jgi:hypothetical protein
MFFMLYNPHSIRFGGFLFYMVRNPVIRIKKNNEEGCSSVIVRAL